MQRLRRLDRRWRQLSSCSARIATASTCGDGSLKERPISQYPIGLPVQACASARWGDTSGRNEALRIGVELGRELKLPIDFLGSDAERLVGVHPDLSELEALERQALDEDGMAAERVRRLAIDEDKAHERVKSRPSRIECALRHITCHPNIVNRLASGTSVGPQIDPASALRCGATLRSPGLRRNLDHRREGPRSHADLK